MGLVTIGGTRYQSMEVVVSDDCLILDDRKIYLGRDRSPIQVKVLSFEECVTRKLKSDVSVLITGDVNHVSCKNLCLWGRSNSISYGSNKFYNTTGKEEYKKFKSLMSKKYDTRRIVVRCIGEFDSISVRKSNIPTEVVVEGRLNDCYSRGDVYCKGIIQRSRSSENSYISTK